MTTSMRSRSLDVTTEQTKNGIASTPVDVGETEKCNAVTMLEVNLEVRGGLGAHFQLINK
jgi:hypothetical protein